MGCAQARGLCLFVRPVVSAVPGVKQRQKVSNDLNSFKKENY